MSDQPAVLATIKAYRIAGGANVRIERDGCVRRHRVSLRRYRSLVDWTIQRCPWKHGGQWKRNGLDITILNAPHGYPPLPRRRA